MPNELHRKDGSMSLLTSVEVVMRAIPILPELSHITHTIDTFLDPTVDWSLAKAASFHSLELLQRVTDRHVEQWRMLPPLLVKAFRQEQFTNAMNVMAKFGFLSGAQWLRDVYFPEGEIMDAVEVAIANGHATMLDWLLEMYPATMEHETDVLCDAVSSRKYVDVARVVLERYARLGSVPEGREIEFASGHLQIVQLLQESFPSFDLSTSMDEAVLLDNIDTLLWLHEHGAVPFQLYYFPDAVKNGCLSIAQYLYTYHPETASISSGVLNLAASHGHAEMLNWLYDHYRGRYVPRWNWHQFMWSKNPCDPTAVNGHWEVCKWLHAHNFDCMPEFFVLAATNGNLSMLQWLVDKYQHIWDKNKTALDFSLVAQNGFLDVVEWLGDQNLPFSEKTLSHTAWRGHLQVVQWFHKHRSHLFTYKTMNSAAGKGHLVIVKFLHENRTEGCSSIAMDYAAANNHLNVVRFLHENRTEGCTTDAMDQTSSIEILEFLNNNRTEGCTSEGYKNAVRGGHLRVFEWFYQHKRELVDLVTAREIATTWNQLHILYWLDAVNAGDVR